MKRLLLALLLAGCGTSKPPIPITDLRGRWWAFPGGESVDIAGDLQIRRVKRAFAGAGRVQGGWVCFTSGESVLLGQYREYSGGQEFLDGEGLFDMGSDFNKAKESLRVLRVREGSAKPGDSLADLWRQLPSNSQYYLISPASQLDSTDERWKKSWWYEADAPVPCRAKE